MFLINEYFQYNNTLKVYSTHELSNLETPTTCLTSFVLSLLSLGSTERTIVGG